MERQRILLIEDHLGERLNIMKVLSSLGVEVETAVTFDRARDLLQKRNYALVISELILCHCPETQGDGAQFWMYSQRIQPALPLLLIATDSARLASELLKFGQSIPSILAKPVRLDVLQSLVERQIQGARILAA